MSDKKFELSRRKALLGLGTVGAASAGAGIGTSAYFSDEESFDGNTIQAGEFGLTVEQQVHGINQDGIGPDEENFDAGVSDDGIWIQDAITIEDAKPGDEYEFCWEITVEDNPGYVALAACYDDWHGVEADNVELDDLWDIDDESNLSTIGDETLVDAVSLENGESASYDYETVGDLLSDLHSGALLDDGGTPVEFGPGETWTLCVDLSIPTDVGNELQGALLEWDLAFYAEQARHNDGGGVADRAADSIVCELDDVTWSEVGREGEAGGPVVLFGLDSELGAGSVNHGPPEEHADMVASVLGSVTNDNDGILVIGAKENGDDAEQYWREDIAEADQVDEDITFVNGADNIRDQEFDDFALIGIASSDDELFGGGGILNDENDAVIDRRGDIADFVNDGGGLIGKTQAGLNNPWEYVDPFGEFIIHEADNDSVEVTDAAKELTFSQEGLDGWCCYHEVFEWDEDEEGDDAKVGFPDFFEVLIINDEFGDNGYRDANAIGGEEVVIEREVSFRITGPGSINVGETESYDVTLKNDGDDSIEGEFEFDVVTGDATVSDTLPDTVELDSGESESWDDAIEVTCNSTGGTEIDAELVDVEDGSRLVEVTMTPECV